MLQGALCATDYAHVLIPVNEVLMAEIDAHVFVVGVPAVAANCIRHLSRETDVTSATSDGSVVH